MSTPYVLQHKRYYMEKRSFTSSNSFTDYITDKCDVKLTILIMYR